MRARVNVAALLLAMTAGAMGQTPRIYTESNWPRVYTDSHGPNGSGQTAGLLKDLFAQQTTTAPGSSSSKQRPTTPQTNKSATTKPSTTGTAAKAAGTSSSKTSITTNWTKYCAPEGDFCVKYPTTWQALGDTADSGGLVIAPAQPNKPAAQWSNVTVAATDLPQPPAGKERPTFDELIGVVLESMRPGVHPQTLERKQMVVDELPAQFLKLKYVEEGQPWIEEIVLIDGEDVVYSMALRCTPDELPSYEPIFREIVGTWKAVASGE